MIRSLLLVACLGSACHLRLGRPSVKPAPQPAELQLVTPASAPGRWFVHLDMGALGIHTWFVDTGYSRTTCDDDFVRAIGVAPRGRTRVRGEAGKLQARVATLPPFSIGEHRITRLVCVVRDLNTTSSVHDVPEGPIAGVIGADLLRRFFTVLDGGPGRFELHAPDHAPLSSSDPDVIRLYRERRIGRRFEIESRIREQPIRFLIDTGSNRTLLLKPGFPEDGQRTVKITATGGSKIRTVNAYDLPAFQLGTAEVPEGLRAFSRIRGPGRQSLLGLDVLASLRMELSPSQRRARLKVSEGPGPATWRSPEPIQRDPPSPDPAPADREP